MDLKEKRILMYENFNILKEMHDGGNLEFVVVRKDIDSEYYSGTMQNEFAGCKIVVQKVKFFNRNSPKDAHFYYSNNRWIDLYNIDIDATMEVNEKYIEKPKSYKLTTEDGRTIEVDLKTAEKLGILR